MFSLRINNLTSLWERHHKGHRRYPDMLKMPWVLHRTSELKEAVRFYTHIDRIIVYSTQPTLIFSVSGCWSGRWNTRWSRIRFLVTSDSCRLIPAPITPYSQPGSSSFLQSWLREIEFCQTIGRLSSVASFIRQQRSPWKQWQRPLADIQKE